MRKLSILLLLTLPVLLCSVTVRHLKTETQFYPKTLSSVLVVDNSNEPIKDLEASNFQLVMGGHGVDSLSVQTFEKTGQGMSLMLCIDNSTSMAGEPLSSVKAAIKKFIGDKRANDEIAISTFAGSWVLVSDFTTETSLLMAKIDEIQAQSGATAMYYGAYKSLEQIKKTARNAAQSLILFGDGKDENQTDAYEEEDVIKLAVENQIPVFTVGYTNVDRQYLQALEHLSEETGGIYYYATNASELSEYYNKLRRQLLNSYVLNYYPIDLPGDGQEQTLVINVTTDMGKGGTEAKIKLPTGRPAHSQVVKKKSKLSTTTLLIILGVLLVVGGLAAFFVIRANKKKAAQKKDFQAFPPFEPLPPVTPTDKSFNEPVREWKEPPVPTKPPIMPDRERTMILNSGSGSTVKTGTNALRLEVMVGPESGKVFTIGREGATIGRASDNQIVLRDDTVSSHHARIYFSDGVFFIEEVAARNGVFINGARAQLYRIEGSVTFKFGTTEGAIALI
ncbi:MAG TPA: VWA domain-containing protein [Candidatus Cloacimonadota bacterium]|nr:VWA domain-containing protein [Candidatus Cloacimonadota bacterium]HPS39124.1 VWA domain-containing protein [Candidatus Cloacimonadota bacterium]